jgi:hypothetical protein
MADQEDLSTPGLTPAERLVQVDAAIASVLAGGQSYRVGSRQLTRASLQQLYAMRNDLQAQVAASSPGLLDDCVVAVFDRR